LDADRRCWQESSIVKFYRAELTNLLLAVTLLERAPSHIVTWVLLFTLYLYKYMGAVSYSPESIRCIKFLHLLYELAALG
jgi:hypothetical protein